MKKSMISLASNAIKDMIYCSSVNTVVCIGPKGDKLNVHPLSPVPAVTHGGHGSHVNLVRNQKLKVSKRRATTDHA
jgi:hypothetical protein